MNVNVKEEFKKLNSKMKAGLKLPKYHKFQKVRFRGAATLPYGLRYSERIIKKVKWDEESSQYKYGVRNNYKIVFVGEGEIESAVAN